MNKKFGMFSDRIFSGKQSIFDRMKKTESDVRAGQRAEVTAMTPDAVAGTMQRWGTYKNGQLVAGDLGDGTSMINADTSLASWWLPITLADDDVTVIYCQLIVTIGGKKYLYVGGTFARIGGVTASNIARYNFETRQWEAVNGGVNNAVRSLAFSPTNELYIGGFFTNAGGDALADYIAKEDGFGSWVNVAGGVNNPVNSVVFSNAGTLHIGGLFTNAGGDASADYIAKISGGGTWVNVNGGVNDWIFAIGFSSSDELYIGGVFTNASLDADADFIAKDGGAGSWVNVNGGVNGTVFTISFSPNGELYIGGDFTSASSDTSANYIAKDNGDGSWVNVGGGVNEKVYSIAHSNQDLIIGGYFTVAGDVDAYCIASNDGTGWKLLTNGGGISGLGGYVYSIAIDPDTNTIYAGGDFDTAGTIQCVGIAAFCRPLSDALDILANQPETLQARSDEKYAATAKGVTNGDSHDHSGGDGAQIDHANLANKGTNTHAQLDSHLTNTSNPHSVTAAQVGAKGYSLSLSCLPQPTTTDGQTVHWGNLPVVPNANTGYARVYIPKTGTIKSAYVFTRSNTAGSGENWSMYIRVNSATDTLIETKGAAAAVRTFVGTGLSIAVNEGDYIEIKEVHPTWATNPADVNRSATIYIE